MQFHGLHLAHLEMKKKEKKRLRFTLTTVHTKEGKNPQELL